MTPWPTPHDLLALRTLRLAGVRPDLVEALALSLGCLPRANRGPTPVLASSMGDAEAARIYYREWLRIKRRFAT